MKRRKLRYTFLGLLALIFGVFALMKQGEAKVSCVPNEERTAIRLIVQNAQIDAITLKYDDGFLQLKQETGELSIRGCGTEYVRIDYLDRSGEQHHTDFKIDASAHSLLIARLNAAGIEEASRAY